MMGKGSRNNYVGSVWHTKRKQEISFLHIYEEEKNTLLVTRHQLFVRSKTFESKRDYTRTILGDLKVLWGQSMISFLKEP